MSNKENVVMPSGMSDNDITVGKRLKYLRGAKGLTQSSFADILGVTRDIIANVESHRNLPNKRMIRQAASYFNVTEDWIMTGRSNLDMLSGTGILDKSDPDASDRVISLMKFISALSDEELITISNVLKKYVEQRKS